MTLNDISYEVLAWCNKNFTVHRPDLGMVEECGELTHCVLKRAQQIRGFEDADFYKAQATDAIGDLLVYFCHWARMKEINLTGDWPEPDMKWADEPFEADLAWTLQCLAEVLNGAIEARHLLSAVVTMSHKLGFDAFECLNVTWAKVKQRDWVKNQKNGEV